MKRYANVAIGGTFDLIHKGHKILLSRAFELGEEVTIGLTSDGFAASIGKELEHPYKERLSALEGYLVEAFPQSKYLISKLNDYFGPAIVLDQIQAIVVSSETAGMVELANKDRERRGLNAMQVETVEMVDADDGKPISTTRIRNNEINSDGQIV